MAVLTDEEVTKRVESPMNLFNRLRSITSHKEKEQLIVSIPRAAEIIPDLDKKVSVGDSRSRALSVMNKVLNRLDSDETINNIKVERLPSMLSRIGTAIKSLEPEKDKEDSRVQFVVYTPTIMKEVEFGEVIEVKE